MLANSKSNTISWHCSIRYQPVHRQHDSINDVKLPHTHFYNAIPTGKHHNGHPIQLMNTKEYPARIAHSTPVCVDLQISFHIHHHNQLYSVRVSISVLNEHTFSIVVHTISAVPCTHCPSCGMLPIPWLQLCCFKHQYGSFAHTILLSSNPLTKYHFFENRKHLPYHEQSFHFHCRCSGVDVRGSNNKPSTGGVESNCS